MTRWTRKKGKELQVGKSNFKFQHVRNGVEFYKCANNFCSGRAAFGSEIKGDKENMKGYWITKCTHLGK